MRHKHINEGYQPNDRLDTSNPPTNIGGLVQDAKTDRELRNEYALEIARHLGWRQLKGAPSLWSNGKYNPKYKAEVIRRHKSVAFLRQQIIERGLAHQTAMLMLSDSPSAVTQILKIILDDIKKQNGEEELV